MPMIYFEYLTRQKVCNKVLTILTYFSEVWGIYGKSDYSRWDKDSIESHIHFCKTCLGLNKRSPNVTSRNELGRLSLSLQITMNIFKFWIHLENRAFLSRLLHKFIKPAKGRVYEAEEFIFHRIDQPLHL